MSECVFLIMNCTGHYVIKSVVSAIPGFPAVLMESVRRLTLKCLNFGGKIQIRVERCISLVEKNWGLQSLRVEWDSDAFKILI